jgi:hypothetical protein
MRKLSILGVVLTALALTAVAWSSRGGAATDVHDHPQSTATPQEELAPLLARARLATADYAISLRRALRAGYTTIVTQHMPDMGWHFMNPKITKFDVTKPPILVYVHRAGRWQLVAFEWVFTQQPATDPLRERNTAPSPLPATTSTVPSILPRPRPSAAAGALRAGRSSASGTPT